TELVKLIDSGEVTKVHQVGEAVTIQTKDVDQFVSYLSSSMENTFYSDYLKAKVESGDLVYSSEKKAESPWYSEIITTVLMLAGFGLIWFFFMQQMQGNNNKAMSFGKSRAKLHKDNNMVNITFKDVAGLEEEKEELEEIVDFLKSPKKYNDLGARIPTGVLMVGPPGTGKTYLSKAVAGEAGVPFFSISGSDFVEMFVGVGASRVRDLFETAKRQAPAIVFIDEIDAVGRRRGAGVGGGHDEREQTLNQLLVEMDGFSKNEGIIVMAATNRADILDPAILRPGRFDRTIYVGPPDVRGRESILKIHTRNKPLAEDVDLKVIAKRTPGFTPADLENLVNEAALLSARFNQKSINMENINEASIKVQAGPAKKSKVVTDADRRLTAVHEAGHALVSRFTPDSDPIHMITIIPRGMAGGFTAYLPNEEHS
ncbi:MAG: ATP-dependent zinc metalloprotease FtsH, partial [Gallicola sp.]|nr:ATP-dependent zinc metalloprotease FtsH [Gallicola sp.]